MEKAKNAANPKGIHSGHRSHMRERFLKTGFDGFQQHEIAEMLLYYPIMQKDTNPLAHLLIDRFGSVDGILRASEGELRSVQGMTNGAVFFIMFLREVYTHISAQHGFGVDLSAPAARREYFEKLYALERNEIVYAAFLNSEGYLISLERIGSGHPTATEFDIRLLTKLAYDTGSNHIVLAHNHPSSSADLSSADIQTTHRLESILHTSSIRLLDHIVVGCDRSISMVESGLDDLGSFLF